MAMVNEESEMRVYSIRSPQRYKKVRRLGVDDGEGAQQSHLLEGGTKSKIPRQSLPRLGASSCCVSSSLWPTTLSITPSRDHSVLNRFHACSKIGDTFDLYWQGMDQYWIDMDNSMGDMSAGRPDLNPWRQQNASFNFKYLAFVLLFCSTSWSRRLLVSMLASPP